MSIALLSPRASADVSNETKKSTTSITSRLTTDFGICDCSARANTLNGTSGEFENSKRKCIVCGENCGRPVALDLFCGAGGTAYGLRLAGFCVLGLDIKRQPRYAGCRFIQADALKPPVRLEDFDLIWASPPCQGYSALRTMPTAKEHPRLIEQVRESLLGDRMWVIENVPGAPLRAPFMLCGSMFGLDVRRHRLFESNFFVPTMRCNHRVHTPRFQSFDKRRLGAMSSVVGVYGGGNHKGDNRECRQKAMGMEWADDYGLTQAIPPAYAEHIGRYAMMALGGSGE